MEGQWKRLDLEIQQAVSLAIERQKLELGEFLWAPQGTSYRHEHQVGQGLFTSDARGLNHSWEEIQEAIVKIEGRRNECS